MTLLNKTEQEVIQNRISEETPLVSICCITYNHENYIKEALDSLLMQKTNFSFEIIVRDDSSTDKTANIISKYVEKFPNIIKPIFENENTFSKGINPMPPVLKKSRGKYIALCEGDDYWISEHKLQSQIDLLERNENISLVFQNAQIREFDENEKLIDVRKHHSSITEGIVTVKQILENKIIPTSSVVFRDIKVENFIETTSSKYPVGDTALFMYFAKFGDIYYMDEETSVYRLQSRGMVKSQLSTISKNLEFIPYYKDLKKEFSEFELDDLIDKLILIRYEKIIKLYVKDKSYINMVKYAFILFKLDPKYFVSFLAKYIKY